MRNKILYIILSLVFLAIPANRALAHQPRYVGQQLDITVQNPETSQAFYGELTGIPVSFLIESTTPFKLYAQLLVPKIAGAEKNITAQINLEGRQLAYLNGAAAQWSTFKEPFAGDTYWQGPSYSKESGPGQYWITVSSSTGYGKYVLVIGESESFTVSEAISTLKILPTLKTQFFDKPAISALYNYIGLAILIVIVVITGVIVVVVYRLRRRNILKRIEQEYPKNF